MRVFPTHLFGFSDIDPDIDRRTITGGAALSGSEDVIATDGGGRVFVEFGDPYLDEPDLARAWRAISDVLQGGVTPVIVPLADLRHQQGREVRVPRSLPFWTEAEYATGTSGVTLAADAALRATTLQLAFAYVPFVPLQAGIWLSIDHATIRHRAYRIAEVVSQSGTAATVKLSHPLRIATTAGLAVELTDPRCVMRLEGEMRSPTNFGFASGGQIRFVEHFLAPEGSYA